MPVFKMALGLQKNFFFKMFNLPKTIAQQSIQMVIYLKWVVLTAQKWYFTLTF